MGEVGVEGGEGAEVGRGEHENMYYKGDDGGRIEEEGRRLGNTGDKGVRREKHVDANRNLTKSLLEKSIKESFLGVT